MAAGFPDSAKLEIEFTAGTWTDVTTYVDWSTGVEIKQGRSSEFDDVSPGELSVTLYNLPDTSTSISPFTPDSPLSPYYPNVTKGKRIRYTITYASTSYQRFIGWIQAWSLNLSDSVVEATVTISAIDRLGVQNAQPMNALWAENWRTESQLAGASWDVWPLDEVKHATGYRNINLSAQPGLIVYGPSKTGKIDLQTSPVGIFADGALSVSPDATASRSAPYVWVQPTGWGSSTHRQFMFAFRSTEKTNDTIIAAIYATTTPNTRPVGRIILAANGQLTWVVSSTSADPASGVSFDMANGTGTDSGLRYNDGKWHTVFMFDDTVTTQWVCFIDGGYQANTSTSSAAYLVVGSDPYTGAADATNRARSLSFGGAEKNAYGFNGDITMIAANTDNVYASSYGGYETWGLRNTKQVQDAVGVVLRSDLGATAIAGTNYMITGSDNRSIGIGQTAGTTIGDTLTTIARTVGATYWVNPTTGLPTFIASDANRPTSSLITINLGGDDEISVSQQWAQNVQSKPTRVTVTSPYTTLVAVDTVAEAAGIPVNESNIDTWSFTATTALDPAWARLRVSSTLRLSQLGVDLVTAQTSFYASLCGSARPGMRITVANIPTGFIGISQTDVYVQGWVEKYASDAVLWTFDTTPADAPGEAVFDTTRFSWGDGVCSVSACTASTTSLTLTWTGTAALSTTAGDYPLDLNVNGERITITSAPAGGSSPQTVTVTRGVSPTVARAHSAGEPVDLWNGYTYAF